MRPHQAAIEAADPIGDAAEPQNEEIIQKPLPSVDSLESRGTPRMTSAIHLLRWIELIGLESDYKQFRNQENTDRWYYLEDGEAKGPASFTELLTKVRDGFSPLTIIHESKAQDEEPQWTELTYNPVWTRPTVALWWTIGFWFIVLSTGFVALQLVLPDNIRGIAGIVYWLAVAAAIFQKNKHRFLKSSHMLS